MTQPPAQQKWPFDPPKLEEKQPGVPKGEKPAEPQGQRPAEPPTK